jgi:hypothetical protein
LLLIVDPTLACLSPNTSWLQWHVGGFPVVATISYLIKTQPLLKLTATTYFLWFQALGKSL